MRTDRLTGAIVVAAIAAAATAAPDVATRFSDGDTDRVPAHTVMPEYPRKARRDRIEGEVQVCFHIDRRGRPYRIAVRHSTHRIFEKPSRQAVRQSTWLPLGPDEAVPGIKTCRTFRFELEPAGDGSRG